MQSPSTKGSAPPAGRASNVQAEQMIEETADVTGTGTADIWTLGTMDINIT